MRVAILDDYQNVARELADWSGLDTTVFTDHLTHETALAERLAPFEAICLMRERTPFPRSLIEKLPNLKLLITAGMYNASIDLEAAHDNGVFVSGTTAPVAQGTAELTLALILALARGLVGEADSLRNGGWQHRLGRNIAGQTLGVVGLGKLGGEVARLALAFNMNVVAWSTNLSDERAAEVGVRRVARETLFAESDFVSVHLVLSNRSRSLIGADDFARMKHDAYFINTSRGPIVDNEALLAALCERRIAGAGIDVYDTEPLPADAPWRSLDNVLATPHIGFVTRQTYETWYPQMAEDVRAFVAGKPIRPIGSRG
ncbi:MAG: D-2-hydroxyacid dehydrogenase family protein [Alphaproteobacteria bacterium]|jgi:phosphoglycerate dehydrogenase-like enzyme